MLACRMMGASCGESGRFRWYYGETPGAVSRLPGPGDAPPGYALVAVTWAPIPPAGLPPSDTGDGAGGLFGGLGGGPFF